jgi:hypothetical protein
LKTVAAQTFDFVLGQIWWSLCVELRAAFVAICGAQHLWRINAVY